jgi:ADP-ribose pyrophosphatase
VTDADRRAARLARYEELRAQRPALFANPPEAAYEILTDPADQSAVTEIMAAQMRERGLPEANGDVGVVYEDSYFILIRDAVRYRDGETGSYVRLLNAAVGTNAAVLPIFADGQVALVRHFRHGSRRWHWEIPRGFAEPGADGAATARTELVEEIGVRADRVRLLGVLDDDGEPAEIYAAEIDAAGPDAVLQAEAVEGIDEIRLVTIAELTRMVAEREITDAFALAAYAFAVAAGLVK